MNTGRRTGWKWLAGPALVAAAVTWAPTGWAAPADLARLIEAAKQEGEVHYIDASTHPKPRPCPEPRSPRRNGLPTAFPFPLPCGATGGWGPPSSRGCRRARHSL